MSPAISRIIADPNRDLLGIMSNGTVITRNARDSWQQGRVQKDQSGGGPGSSDGRTALSQQEQKILEELQARDREVRLHEQKHLAAAGTLAKGGPKYEYAIGPDGKPYAIGGHVRIDTSSVAEADENRARANQIQRAATAPGDPSGPDMGVAQQAGELQSLARQASIEYRRNEPFQGADMGSSRNGAEKGYSLRLWG
ncbi:MAG: hypothetical protein KDK25_04855 [Leptospiraceae bacterium]|nr:hypothetical protein [Leptospiraceae bacterium]MCB1169637.1 hypothetical protein [Leptospiraceae bacterium]